MCPCAAAEELFQSMAPKSSPVDTQGLDMVLGGVGFSPTYNYECRFFCETSFCSDLFFHSAIIPSVKSPARFVSSSILNCTIPTWPFQASSTNVSVWRGSIQIQKDPAFSNSNLDIFTFYGTFFYVIHGVSPPEKVDSSSVQRSGNQHPYGIH